MIKLNILICGDTRDHLFKQNIDSIINSNVSSDKIIFRLIVIGTQVKDPELENILSSKPHIEFIYQYLRNPTRSDVFLKMFEFVEGTHLIILGSSFMLNESWADSVLTAINRYYDHIVCHGKDKDTRCIKSILLDRFGMYAVPLEYLQGIATIFPINTIELVNSKNPVFMSNSMFNERGITDLELTFMCTAIGAPIIVSETFQIGKIITKSKSLIINSLLLIFRSFEYGWQYSKLEAYLVEASEFISSSRLSTLYKCYKAFFKFLFKIKGPEITKKNGESRYLHLFRWIFLLGQALYITFKYADFREKYFKIKKFIETLNITFNKIEIVEKDILKNELIEKTELCDSNANLNLLELERRKLVLESYPVKLYVEPSDMCNLSCTYCYPSSVRKKVNMDMELFKQIEKQLFFKASEVNLFLTGEPTLHPQFNQMLDICSQYKFTTKFFSNLSYRNDKILEQMVDTGVFLNVSFDGPKENSKLRVGINEELVLKNIKLMLDRKKVTNNHKFHMRIASVMSKANVKELNALLEFVTDLGVTELMLGCIDLPGGKLNPLSLTSDDADLFESAMEVATKNGLRLTTPTHIGGRRLKKSSNVLDFNIASDQSFRRYPELYNPDVENKFCPYPWIETVIHSDGRISSCCQRKHQIAFWDKNKTDFIKDVWNNQNYQRLRNIPDYNYCSSCSERYQCNMMKYSIWGGYLGANQTSKH